jgi:TRAP-type mannitol/chloroaromatic compound transport system permease small subunit
MPRARQPNRSTSDKRARLLPLPDWRILVRNPDFKVGKSMLRLLDRVVALAVAGGQWFALPIAILLFLQWPLRDLLGLYSREANDLGQWIFALYVSMSITAATRARVHLAADVLARRYSERWRGLLSRLGTAFGLIPWALFVIVSSWNIVISSALMRETFADTQNPGYFVIKLALWLMAALVLIEGVIELFRTGPRDRGTTTELA